MIVNWLPRLIAGLGVIHLVYVVAESPGVVRDMLADGFVGASNDYRRDFVTWFFIGGLVLLMIAATARWAIRVTGRFPRPLAVGMLAIGVFDTLLEPNGGGYLMVLLGALATYAAYRSSAAGGLADLEGVRDGQVAGGRVAGAGDAFEQ